MRRIDAIIRPEKLQQVIRALDGVGVHGFTVIPVQGRGQQTDTRGIYRGHPYEINVHPKLKLEIVVSNEFCKPAVQAIISAAHTGQKGDGKVFVFEVLEAYNVRTGRIDETIDELNKGGG